MIWQADRLSQWHLLFHTIDLLTDGRDLSAVALTFGFAGSSSDTRPAATREQPPLIFFRPQADQHPTLAGEAKTMLGRFGRQIGHATC